jgi:predicted alpha/beta-fold hydrolase
MNLRGAGDGFGLARGFYHAGRSEDVRAVLSWMAVRFPLSPIALVGFSLGGSLALKLAAEASEQAVTGLDCVLAANPPIDLAACAETMQSPLNRLYGWYFLGSLVADVKRLHRRFPELGKPNLTRVRSVFDFDDRYTAPRNGFASAQDYYHRCSVWPLIPRIRHDGLVVHAQDDPFVPADTFARVRFPGNLPLDLSRNGGHMGYVSRDSWLGDHRWLDARLATWLAARWGISTELMQTSSSSRAWGGVNHGVHRGRPGSEE